MIEIKKEIDMKALINSALVTAREIALQEHKHAHQVKLTRMSAVNPWLSPTVLIPAAVLAIQYGPAVVRFGKLKLQDYREKRVASYIETKFSQS